MGTYPFVRSLLWHDSQSGAVGSPYGITHAPTRWGKKKKKLCEEKPKKKKEKMQEGKWKKNMGKFVDKSCSAIFNWRAGARVADRSGAWGPYLRVVRVLPAWSSVAR